MNERYREAADAYEERAEYCKRMAGIEGGVPPLTGSRHSWEEDAKRHELAALILSKLATGEWVLCPKEPTVQMINAGVARGQSDSAPSNIDCWYEDCWKTMLTAAPELP